MRIGPHPDECRTGVNATVAARRKLRRLRGELERGVGGPVLSALHPDGGTALIPLTGVASDADWARLDVLVASAARAAGADVPVGALVAAPAGGGRGEHGGRGARCRGRRRPAAGGAPVGRRGTGVDVALEFQLTRPGPARDSLAALLEPVMSAPELLGTLRAYFRNGLSGRNTAKELHLHPNTVPAAPGRRPDRARHDGARRAPPDPRGTPRPAGGGRRPPRRAGGMTGVVPAAKNCRCIPLRSF